MEDPLKITVESESVTHDISSSSISERELEAVFLNVEKSLLKFSADQLLNAALMFDIRLSKVKDKSEADILRCIRLQFEKVSSKSLTDAKTLLDKVGTYLHDIISDVCSENEDSEHEHSDDNDVESGDSHEKRRTEKMLDEEAVDTKVRSVTEKIKGKRLEKEVLELRKELATMKVSLAAKSQKESDSVTKDRSDGKSVSLSTLREAWRPEFKIRGQVGRMGQKDKLSFTSLLRQIESGEDLGYTERELIDGVIKSTTAGIRLRTFLESKRDLTLSLLKDILRSYYQEADSKDLLQQLATIKQELDEDPQSFVIRGLEIKQRILLEGENDSQMKFDSDVIQNILLQSMRTGFANESVRNHMRPYLQSNVADEDLLRQVSRAIKDDKDQKSKFPRRYGRVNEIGEGKCEEGNDGQCKKKKDDLTTVMESLVSSIAEIRSELKEVKSEFHERRQANRPKVRTYGCDTCKSEGKGRTCSHCFSCGKSGHQVRQCPDKQHLNKNRSVPGDME